MLDEFDDDLSEDNKDVKEFDVEMTTESSSSSEDDRNEASTSQRRSQRLKRKRKTDFVYLPIESDDESDDDNDYLDVEDIKRQGKNFVRNGLNAFKKVKDKESLKPFIEKLYLYLRNASINYLSLIINDVIDKYYHPKESSEEIFDTMTRDLDEYKNLEEENLLKLQYAIQWIGKRIEFLNRNLQQAFSSIEYDLLTTKSFFESVSNDVREIRRELKQVSSLKSSGLKKAFDKLMENLNKTMLSNNSLQAIDKIMDLGNIKQFQEKQMVINCSI